jgi:hypothetical protein
MLEVGLYLELVSSAADVHEKCGHSGRARKVRLARVGMAVLLIRSSMRTFLREASYAHSCTHALGLVAPFSLFRFFWACKRNENRKQSRNIAGSVIWKVRKQRSRKSDTSFDSEKSILIKAPWDIFSKKH